MRCSCHLSALVFANWNVDNKNLKGKGDLKKKKKKCNLKKKERPGTERDSNTGTERVSFKDKAILISVHFFIYVHFFVIFRLNTVHFDFCVSFIFRYAYFQFKLHFFLSIFSAHFGANVRASMRAAKWSGAHDVLTLACCI